MTEPHAHSTQLISAPSILYIMFFIPPGLYILVHIINCIHIYINKKCNLEEYEEDEEYEDDLSSDNSYEPPPNIPIPTQAHIIEPVIRIINSKKKNKKIEKSTIQENNDDGDDGLPSYSEVGDQV